MHPFLDHRDRGWCRQGPGSITNLAELTQWDDLIIAAAARPGAESFNGVNTQTKCMAARGGTFCYQEQPGKYVNFRDGRFEVRIFDGGNAQELLDQADFTGLNDCVSVKQLLWANN